MAVSFTSLVMLRAEQSEIEAFENKHSKLKIHSRTMLWWMNKSV